MFFSRCVATAGPPVFNSLLFHYNVDEEINSQLGPLCSLHVLSMSVWIFSRTHFLLCPKDVHMRLVTVNKWSQ